MFCDLIPQLSERFRLVTPELPAFGQSDMPDPFGDYKSNVALYPTFQEYFRKHQPRFLAAWGRNDPFFLPQGAEAFRRHVPEAVHFFNTGHFVLETHANEIAALIRDFLAR